MIDTDKYEGHQLSEFKISVAGVNHSWVKRQQTHGAIDTMFVKHATAALIADAPLLLEAYKQVRELLTEVLPRKDGLPHMGTILWGLESELKRVVSEIAIIMGMAEREEE